MAEGPQIVSLYRRFRPARFSELRGQPHVVRALQGAVRDGRVGHAYLFSGPRGTGKTSTARILAAALNCERPEDGEPCGTCTSCTEIARGSSFDVHELDAASNNGVDAMRDLVAHAALATPGRWKVYIVDEVHMLSNAAASALLKTLEEPPGHVVFVLATTEPKKVLPTIRSRTQHLEFGLIGTDTLGGLLHDVSAAASLGVTDDDIAVAVRKGRGSARDALSALDQVVASGSSDALRPSVAGVAESIASGDAGRALLEVATLHETGWGPQQIATELVDDLRQGFLVVLAPDLCEASGADRERLVSLSGELGLPRIVRCIEVLGRAQVDMRDAPDPRAVLESVLVRLARPAVDDPVPALVERVARLERAAAAALAGGTRTAPSSPDLPVGDRPGLGALRRKRLAETGTPSPDPAAPAPPEAGSPAPTAATAAAQDPDPAPAPPNDAAGPPDRDALVEAWGDEILRSLPARAKAMFSAGRFVAADGHVATFVLPNAAHRARCEEVRSVVEDAISTHFGVRVSLALGVEETTPGPGPSPGRDDDESAVEVDPVQPEGSPSEVAAARLLEAFPGAEEVGG